MKLFNKHVIQYVLMENISDPFYLHPPPVYSCCNNICTMYNILTSELHLYNILASGLHLHYVHGNLGTVSCILFNMIQQLFVGVELNCSRT